MSIVAMPENDDDTNTPVETPAKRKRGGREVTTTNGLPPAPGLEDAPAPQPAGPDGQHGAYWVLTDAERAKGFVRPVRNSYKHVGAPPPRFDLVDLTAEQRERYGDQYAKWEPYPESERPSLGRYWSQADLDAIGKGCGTVTKMGSMIAETYAAQPDYYGSTFCVQCGTHLKVGRDGHFVWMDGERETTERVGS